MTELTLEIPGEHHFIRSVDENGIRVSDTIYTGSLLLGANLLVEDWAPAAFSDLQPAHFKPVLEQKPDVVLLGTGSQQIFPALDLIADFYRAQIGIEIMSTDAAARTFNVLVSEDRKVLAALLPILS